MRFLNIADFNMIVEHMKVIYKHACGGYSQALLRPHGSDSRCSAQARFSCLKCHFGADRKARRQLVRDDRMKERLAENCLSDVYVE